MSLKIYSNLLEEVNRLADQFSRLTLSDNVKRLSTMNNAEFVDDKTSTKVENLTSLIVNSHEPANAKGMLPTNAAENECGISTDKIICTTIYAESILVDVNKDDCPTDETFCPLIYSSPVSEDVSHAPTSEKKVSPTDVENDKSCLNKTCCTKHVNVNVSEDVTCVSCTPTREKELLTENKGSSGDKTLGTRFYAGPSPKDSHDCTAVHEKEITSRNVVENIHGTCVSAISTFWSLSQNVPLADNEMQRNDADRNNDGSSSDKTACSKFYAVALPEDAEHPLDINMLVYAELKDALSAVKSCKGSRFKEFSKKEDALTFASQLLEKIVGKVKPEEDGSTLRSATSQELCQLRKYIERGDEINFVKTVWSNPKILVGTCDTPSIMQQGMRYNALHVAAKTNKPYMCQLILDTIENPKFLKQIYPSKIEIEPEKIVYRLLDLYINTPDKNGDTPLHYASKFGCIDCVRVLLAHPFCVPDRRNVAGFTPRQIICDRLQPKSIPLIEVIEEAFKGLLYIPVLRSEDNDVPPVVGRPCFCKNIIESTRGSELKDAKSIMSLKAFVGPMSPDIAEQIYLVLKKPSASQDPKDLKLIFKIRNNDREKGLERIGRCVAKDLNVPWQEYFPFLNTFTNLALDEGLRSLETHFKICRQDHYVPHASDVEEQSLFLVHQYPSHVNPLAHYVNVHLERKTEKEDDNKYDEIYCTPPSSPVKNYDGDCFVTPPGSPAQYSDALSDDVVFLEGSCISKLDVDVLLAIGDAAVDARLYPNVSKWKAFVKSKLKDAVEMKPPHVDSLTLLTSVVLPRLHLSEKICTPKKTLLNNAFCFENSN